MNPKEFLSTIYLGDRACLGVTIDRSKAVVRVSIDSISRIRGGAWNFYDAEDVNEGCLLMSGVSSFSMSSPEKSPNDWVEVIGVEPFDDAWLISLSLGSVDEKGLSSEILLKVIAKSLCIETKSGKLIEE